MCECRGILEIPRSFSVDSVIDCDSSGSNEEGGSLLHAQCSQVFIGMVTMQYQARQVLQSRTWNNYLIPVQTLAFASFNLVPL